MFLKYLLFRIASIFFPSLSNVSEIIERSGPIWRKISVRLSDLLKILRALNTRQSGRLDDWFRFEFTPSLIGCPGILCPDTGDRLAAIGFPKASSSVSYSVLFTDSILLFPSNWGIIVALLPCILLFCGGFISVRVVARERIVQSLSFPKYQTCFVLECCGMFELVLACDSCAYFSAADIVFEDKWSEKLMRRNNWRVGE